MGRDIRGGSPRFGKGRSQLRGGSRSSSNVVTVPTRICCENDLQNQAPFISVHQFARTANISGAGPSHSRLPRERARTRFPRAERRRFDGAIDDTPRALRVRVIQVSPPQR